MFRFAKIYPFVVALIIGSGIADKNHNSPVMYGQCQIDEYLMYTIGNTESYEYHISTSNRTVLDSFDYENFVMRPIERGANFYFRSAEPHSFKPMKPTEECGNYGICNEVKNYPKVEIWKLIEDYRKIHNLEITHFIENDDADKLTTRNEFCSVTTQIFQPQAGQDEKNDWYYIVNTESHEQVIRTNVCSNPTPAAELKVSRPWEEKCVQEYYYRNFKAISWNGDIINKMFRVPSYCSCVIIKKLKKKKRH